MDTDNNAAIAASLEEEGSFLDERDLRSWLDEN
jgi:hypothetical protein